MSMKTNTQGEDANGTQAKGRSLSPTAAKAVDWFLQGAAGDAASEFDAGSLMMSSYSLQSSGSQMADDAEGVEKLLSLLDHLPVPEASPNLVARTMSRIEAAAGDGPAVSVRPPAHVGTGRVATPNAPGSEKA